MKDMYDDEDLQRLYDKTYFSTRSRPPMWIRRAEFILEKFHPKTVLDVGCAYGELVKGLVDMGVDAYGVDGSEYAINNSDPLIRSKLFDVVGSFYSIEHIHNIDFFAKELQRILKDDGIAWFLTPNEGLEQRNETDVFTNTFEEWKKIFEDRSFKVTKFSPHEMMALRGKLGKFKFYSWPKSLQNIIKKVAYDYSNRKMKDTSFILTKN
jgi:2-polyprenyl-3-methyl-5-hydroxy-6-metoxy-1,4-benzoquinol methylase